MRLNLLKIRSVRFRPLFSSTSLSFQRTSLRPLRPHFVLVRCFNRTATVCASTSSTLSSSAPSSSSSVGSSSNAQLQLQQQLTEAVKHVKDSVKSYDDYYTRARALNTFVGDIEAVIALLKSVHLFLSLSTNDLYCPIDSVKTEVFDSIYSLQQCLQKMKNASSSSNSRSNPLPSDIFETLNDNLQLWHSHFLPTTPLQDASLDNGWGDQYCALADMFDGTFLSIKKRPEWIQKGSSAKMASGDV
eukprot:TRINITY_DN5924_c0_g1_i1.p1 TRINITY_DN5924_c0_g1~~TRINITY_DN5924_c0_g1_i1.p1  ORF type:complete len:245 (-),score=48.25 TRINITY_DN5924_c0_g1_i1:182-916(-)